LPIHGEISQVTSSESGIVIAWHKTEYALSFDHGDTWTSTVLSQEDAIREIGIARNDAIAWILIYTPSTSSTREKIILGTVSRLGLEDLQINLLFNRIQPIDPLNGWARYDENFFTTDDGGRTWNKRPPIPLHGGEKIRTTEQAESGTIVATSTGRF